MDAKAIATLASAINAQGQVLARLELGARAAGWLNAAERAAISRDDIIKLLK
jgi:hypothetical protein